MVEYLKNAKIKNNILKQLLKIIFNMHIRSVYHKGKSYYNC